MADRGDLWSRRWSRDEPSLAWGGVGPSIADSKSRVKLEGEPAPRYVAQGTALHDQNGSRATGLTAGRAARRARGADTGPDGRPGADRVHATRALGAPPRTRGVRTTGHGNRRGTVAPSGRAAVQLRRVIHEDPGRRAPRHDRSRPGHRHESRRARPGSQCQRRAPGLPGRPGSEPDLAAASRQGQGVGRAMDELLRWHRGQGPTWRKAISSSPRGSKALWGPNYPRLVERMIARASSWSTTAWGARRRVPMA